MITAKRIEIWFFIGALLFVYGLIISLSGVYYLFNPPAREVALFGLHSDIWWGALLVVVGLIYGMKFWPFERKKENSN